MQNRNAYSYWRCIEQHNTNLDNAYGYVKDGKYHRYARIHKVFVWYLFKKINILQVLEQKHSGMFYWKTIYSMMDKFYQ